MVFRKKTFVLISLILILGAFLRLYSIEDYLTFLGDEGRDVLIAREILHGEFTLLGPRASAGDFFLGPIYYYLIAPFLFLTNYNPVGPAIMVALFGIATIFLVFKIGTSFFDKKAALVASALYAVSPIVIAYSRSSWNPNIMPFFSIATLLFVYLGMLKRSAKFLLLSGVFLGISMQLHYLSVFIGTIIFFYILFTSIYIFFKGTKRIGSLFLELGKRYFSIFVGFLLGFSPFLLFELRHGFPNTKTIFNFIFSSGNVGGGSEGSKIISDVLFRLFARITFNFPPAEQFYKYPDSLIEGWKLGILLLALASIALLVYQLKKSVNLSEKKFLQLSLVFCWLLFGVFLFGLYKKPIYDYYLGFLFPVPFLLIGNLLSKLYNKKIIFKIIAIFIFLILFYINIKENPFRYAPNRQYYQVKQASEFILKQANNKPFNFALISGGNSDHAYRYIFTINKNSPVTIENFENDPQRKTTTEQLFIVCEEIPCHPLGHSLWEISGFGRAEIENEWTVSVLKIYKLTPYIEQ